MNIIGISSYYHDAAACLLQDGVLVAAVQEERFSRRKHDPRLPLNAMQYCLQAGDISLADVNCVAYYENPIQKLERQVWMELPHLGESHLSESRLNDPRRPFREIRDRFGYEGRVSC